MPLIFVVDGEVKRSSLARHALEQAGYSVEVFDTGQALESARGRRPDLFLIAVELSGGSGIDLCRRIRAGAAPGRTRIILMGDLPEARYRVVAESGADDFIVCPFSPRELTSCVEGLIYRLLPLALHNRSPKETEADISIDSSALRVKVRGNEVSITTLEFQLIDYMARHRGKVLTRDALLDAVWGDLQFVAPRSVDACVGRIRRKIELDPGSPQFLKTIRGIGYKLDATAIWEETSRELCQCISCVDSRTRSRAPLRRVAT